MSDRGLLSSPVRRLTLADLPGCLELTVDRGWLPEEPKWRLMFAVSELYGIGDPAGGLAGVVGLTRYGGELAAVGMMLVASKHGRRGLGGQLMSHVLEQADGATVCLYATAMGRPLYERLGFRVADVARKYGGSFAPAGAAGYPPPAGLRSVDSAGLDAVAELDEQAFGASRRAVLTRLAGLADGFMVCGEPSAGYGIVWGNGELSCIGPVMASDERVVPGLLDALLAGHTGEVRLDVSRQHPELARWAEARGLRTDRETAIMVRGGRLPGNRAWLYAPANVALG